MKNMKQLAVAVWLASALVVQTGATVYAVGVGPHPDHRNQLGEMEAAPASVTDAAIVAAIDTYRTGERKASAASAVQLYREGEREDWGHLLLPEAQAADVAISLHELQLYGAGEQEVTTHTARHVAEPDAGMIRRDGSFLHGR